MINGDPLQIWSILVLLGIIAFMLVGGLGLSFVSLFTRKKPKHDDADEAQHSDFSAPAEAVSFAEEAPETETETPEFLTRRSVKQPPENY